MGVLPRFSAGLPLCISEEKTTTQQIDNENGVLNLKRKTKLTDK
jgi:hypothetical protein